MVASCLGFVFEAGPVTRLGSYRKFRIHLESVRFRRTKGLGRAPPNRQELPRTFGRGA